MKIPIKTKNENFFPKDLAIAERRGASADKKNEVKDVFGQDNRKSQVYKYLDQIKSEQYNRKFVEGLLKKKFTLDDSTIARYLDDKGYKNADLGASADKKNAGMVVGDRVIRKDGRGSVAKVKDIYMAGEGGKVPCCCIVYPSGTEEYLAQRDVKKVKTKNSDRNKPTDPEFENDISDRKENPGWVKDHSIWEKAKAAVPKGRWAEVTDVYKKMGGQIKE